MKNFLFSKIISLAIILASALVLAESGDPKSGSIIEMVRIKGGTFTMGSPIDEPGRYADETQHTVTVSDFYMGKYEVTQAQYFSVTGERPIKFSGDKLPEEGVSWYEAIVFCNKLSIKEGLKPVYSISGITDPKNWGPTPANSNGAWDAVKIVEDANGYRLPTEAEWEYACRAGTTTPFNWGTDKISTNQANFDAYYTIGSSELYNNSLPGINRGKRTPVGSFKPNTFGLYDMHGNVWEWCWDWYGEYNVANKKDPKGAVNGSLRVIRGGSWGDYGLSLRSAYRSHDSPEFRFYGNPSESTS